ncbi:MAG TPA: universal stress protein [Streptosporangiaceae bacterium]|jgi:nucleotide-binding universal stress UspA family protein|nr:universal stress protein [Streptosporangiaceae bacterium]
MSSTILLAVDARHDVAEPIELARELSQGAQGSVLVLHIHEFSVGRYGRVQLCCAEEQAEDILPRIVALLEESGVPAESQIRQANSGDVARAILNVADQHDVHAIVLGSNRRTDVPLMPLGSVSHKLLHMARRPVLVVPHHKATATEAGPVGSGQTAEPVAG